MRLEGWQLLLRATDTTPDVCPTCYQAPVIDCSIFGKQALGRRTTNNGWPRCFACQAAQQIDAALTGPDGLIRPELKPVRDALTEIQRPRSLLSNWHNLTSLRLLSDIARGRIELSHQALDAQPHTVSVTYLPAMLVAADELPPRDENAARLHHYTAEVLTGVGDPQLRGVLTRYARWLTTARSRRLGFIRWLKHNGYLTRTRLPDPVPQKDPVTNVNPDAQLEFARHLLHDLGSASIEDCAGACLILLYAQPAAKIVTLTTRDIEVHDGDTYLALGPEPLLLIPPLHALITALPIAKPLGTASTLADPRWLFTGKNAGTHLHPASLMRQMHSLGITTRPSRNTALLHLASTTPPAVFASLVGVSIGTATRWAGLAGAAWNNYAAGPR